MARLRKRWIALLLGHVPVTAVFIWLNWWHKVTLREDKWLATLVAGTLVYSIIVSVCKTREYSFRALGLLFVVAAHAVFYTLSVGALLGAWSLPPWADELLRAYLVVGSPIFAIGITLALNEKEESHDQLEN